MPHDSPTHVPVLLDEVVSALRPVCHDLIVDCTVGLGGHAAALLESTPPAARLLGLDVDAENLEEAGARLAAFSGRVTFVQSNFADLADVLKAQGLAGADAILADLGVSSNQLADPVRGLSFEGDGPLDMRLDRRLARTAADLLASLSERDLADLLYLQSQEGRSRRIAKRIVEARRTARLDSTLLLARLVSQAVGGRRPGTAGRIHPATRTFLALRAAVNREGACLDALLRHVPHVLRLGGRVAIISFHSLEDRRVKESFRRLAREGVFRLLTRKPVVASATERRANPRSRSAKLRVAEKISEPRPETMAGEPGALMTRRLSR